MANLSLFQDYLNNTQIADQNNSFGFSLPQGFETNYEDVAGLKQLPLQRMLKQIGRPLNKLYEEIQEAKRKALEKAGVVRTEARTEVRDAQKKEQ
jgi:hypothetical protein